MATEIDTLTGLINYRQQAENEAHETASNDAGLVRQGDFEAATTLTGATEIADAHWNAWVCNVDENDYGDGELDELKAEYVPYFAKAYLLKLTESLNGDE